MNYLSFFVLMLFVMNIAHADNFRTLPLGAVELETIKIEGRIQTWSFLKVCIDGQAYLLIEGLSRPDGISPSFKDGKPEQCVGKSK